MTQDVFISGFEDPITEFTVTYFDNGVVHVKGGDWIPPEKDYAIKPVTLNHASELRAYELGKRILDHIEKKK